LNRDKALSYATATGGSDMEEFQMNLYDYKILLVPAKIRFPCIGIGFSGGVIL